MKLILASTSNFKSKILSQCHIKHEKMESDFDEICDEKDIYKWTQEIAYGKAKSVADKIIDKDSIIIGIDTVVYYDGKIIGKPKDLNEVRKNVKKLAGNTNSVITGICIYNKNNNKILKTFQETKIKMKEMSDEEIEYYIENEEYLLHASGYIIENIMSCFIEYIHGSYYNILGIPVEKIYEELKNMGYSLKDINS